MQQRLTLLAIQLLGLALEQIVDLRHRAVRVETVLGKERLDARSGVAGGAGGGKDEAVQLLLAPRRQEGGALHRADVRADADRLQHARDGFGQGRVGRQRRQIARVEAVGIARLHHELLGALGIVRGRLELQCEVEFRGNIGRRELAQPEHLRLIDALAIDGEIGRHAHTLVMPGRLRIPLVGERDPVRGGVDRLQREPRRAPELVSQLAHHGERHVGLAALEGDQPRRGTHLIRYLGKGHNSHLYASRPTRAGERGEQARVLFVGREDLFARTQVERREGGVHAVRRRACERDLLAGSAHYFGIARP